MGQATGERGPAEQAAEAERQRRLAIELDRALGRTDVVRVQELLEQGAGHIAEGNGGDSALMRAVYAAGLRWGEEKERGERIVELLLNAGADPNEPDQAGQGRLHTAVSFAEARLATILIAHGADPGMADDKGDAPAHYLAASCDPMGNGGGSHVGLALALAQAGADFKARNKAGVSALERLRAQGHWALADAAQAWEESRELAGALPEALAGRKAAL